MAASPRRLRVLVTNDDGPPSGPTGHSPFVYPFARALVTQLGWDVRVVVPASQRSWVGKSYLIAEKVTGAYFYPAGEDGTEGETRDLPRVTKPGEMEWILLDGTPGPSSAPRPADMGPPSPSMADPPRAAVSASHSTSDVLLDRTAQLVPGGFFRPRHLGVRCSPRPCFRR